jgi:competence protein ComEC
LPHPGDLLYAAAEYLKSCAATDFGPGRLVPWLPVAFGLGVALYFTAEREPSWIAASIAVAAFAAITWAARRHAAGFPLALLLTAFATGFAVITIRAAVIAHPVLDLPVYGASVTGFVEAREEREKSDRVVIRVYKLDGTRMEKPPERVRLSVKRGASPDVGSFVSLKARLNPPLPPLRPGGYDFARDLYFQKIGAVGFVTGAIKVETPPEPQGFRLRYAALIDAIRDGIDKRIRAAVPGDGGAIASALITGKRDAISAPVNEAMYVSSLAHVLSISG